MVKRLGSDSFSWGIERFGAAVILVLVLAFLLVLTFSAYTQTSNVNTNDPSGEHIDFYSDNIFLNILLLAMFLCALYLFCRHGDGIDLRRMERLLMLWCFVLGAGFIASTKLRAPLYSDSHMVTYAAQRAALGDYAMLAENYFRRFPFQLGYVLYSEAFFRVVNPILKGTPDGYKILALQGVNLLWLLLAFHAMIESARLSFRDARVPRLTMLLMFFSLQPILSCTFLYGNIPAFACGCVAVWMYLRFADNGRVGTALLCALSLTAAVTLKLNLLIFLVAIGAVWLIELCKRPTWRSALCLVLTVACVLTVSKLPQRFYEKRTEQDFGSGIPMICWMAMGFSDGHAAPGWYKEDNTVKAFERNGYDPAATAADARAVLRERAAYFAKNPAAAMHFFWQKLRSQWNEPTYESLWINQVQLTYSEKGRLYDFFCGSGARRTAAVMNQLQQLVFLGSLLGALGLWRGKNIRRCLLPLILLGGLTYHLLFEAKSQYALPYFVLMLPLAAYGFHRLFKRVELR